MKKKLPLKDLFIIRTWRISISFFSSLDKRHCINKKKKKKIVNQPLHSNSDKDIFVLNIRFSAIMSVLQISCSLIVSRKETKKKKKRTSSKPMYNKPFVFRSIFSPSLLVWYEDEHTVSFSFFFFDNRVIFRRINIPYSRMTRFCSSFFYHLLIRKIETASFPFSLVKCFFFFFYLTTIRFHFLTRFEDKRSRILFLWWQYTNAFFNIFPNNFKMQFL